MFEPIYNTQELLLLEVKLKQRLHRERGKLI